MTNQNDYFIMGMQIGGRNLDYTAKDYDLTVKSTFSNENETFTSVSVSALLARNNVPMSHKRIADNYFIVKKVFKFQVCSSKITNAEKALLEKYDFRLLEFTTMKQMLDELLLLQKWSNSQDDVLRNNSDNILQIRVKELKYLESCSYSAITDEIYKGYIALGNYLKEISKFRFNF